MLKPSAEGERWLRESIAMIITTFIFASLRVSTREQSKASFAADDLWLLLSILVFYTFLGMIIWAGTEGRYGESPLIVPAAIQLRTAKLLYAAEMPSISTTAAAKISLLCLYRRIFSTTSFRKKSLVVIFPVVGYWVASCVTFSLQCIPVDKIWIPTKEGRCINFAAAFLGLELWNCLNDVIMLLLPLGVIRKLQMSARHKFQLAVLFFLGSAVLFVGVIRMAVLFRAGSTQIDADGDVVWGIIENGLAIICACLPAYRPLLSKLFSITTDFRLWYSSLLQSNRSWGGGSSSSKSTSPANANKTGLDSRKRYNQIADGTLDGAHLTSVTGDVEASGDMVVGKDFPLNSIRVKKTMEVA